VPAGASPVTLIAGGDVSFGRLRGQRLLREPERDDFAPLRRWMDAADVVFVNLESTISDQDGETQSPINKLVFTAPPQAAVSLARAGVDIVSLANNHAWDYGEAALFETFARLTEAGVAHVGAGKTRADAYAPRVVDKNGQSLAFIAVTAVWNQVFVPHPGKERVADAAREPLVASIASARKAGADKVIVSYHGGYEYVDEPHSETVALLHAAIDAGADAAIGHHPHVIQRVAFYRNKPIYFSLGNMLMRMVTAKSWTEFGALARITFAPDASTIVELCPFHIFGFDPIPLSDDPRRTTYERHFRFHMDRLQRNGKLIDPESAATLGAFGADGCAALTPG
jgi:poly-gamma-glutamate synthesis protein (capsule biosynthesis protein)